MRNAYYPLIPLSAKLLMLVSFQSFSVKGQVPKQENGPYIFMFNHESMFDVFMLGGAIPYYINAIGWEGIFKWPLFGYFAKRYGAYPITHDNTDQARSTLKSAEKILITADLTRKKRKEVIDKMAATYILQGALDRMNFKNL